MANLRNIQFLRNATVYESLNAAKSGLATVAENALDGSAILGRYSGTTTGGTEEVRTVMALVYNGTVSFLLNEKEIENALESKDYSGITISDAAVVTNVTEADGVISASSVNVGTLKLTDYEEGTASGKVTSADSINEGIAKLQNQIDAANDKVNALDASSVSGESKVVIDVTQVDGQITATADKLTGVKLDGLTAGTDNKIVATDTLGEALANIQAQIDAMDLTVVSGDGEVIVSVSEADGKVGAEKSAIKDVKLPGYEKTNDTGAIASADTINVALSKLENKTAAITIGNEDGSINVSATTAGTDINVNIKSGEKVLAKDGNAGIYTDIKLSGITPSSTNVREEYALIATDGTTQLGTSIKVYKDSALYNVYIGHVDDTIDTSTGEQATTGTGDTALCFIYHKEDGSYELAPVNVESFLEETEFASGVTATNHIVHGVVDPTSEKDESSVAFLTVDAAGFKVSGIKDAIDTKINKLDADESGNTAHITVGVLEVNGKISGVTVAEDNIANASDLAELSAKTVTSITSTNDSITTSISDTVGNKTFDITTDASKIQMSGFTAAESGFTAITESTSVKGAVEAIEAAFIDNEEVVSSALNDLNSRSNELSAKTFTEIVSPNSSITFTTATTEDGTVAVSAETDASKISGLTAVGNVAGEISGVTATDSVKVGIENLYASLAAEIAARKAAISSTTINGSDAIHVDRSVSGDTVSLILDDSTDGNGSESTGNYNALSITNDGLFLSTKWDCGTFDEP